MIVAALAAEAGLPNGVLNMVHGSHVSYLYFSLFLIHTKFLVYDVAFYRMWISNTKKLIVEQNL